MKAWEHFVAVQETDLGEEAVSRWLRSFKVMRFDAGNLYLQAKDAFHAMWFEEHMRQRVERSLRNNNGRPIRVHVSLEGVEQTPSIGPDSEPSNTLAPAPFKIHFDELNPLAKLDLFLRDKDNELAVKVVEEVIDQGGRGSFNPVYLYGGTGSGKTHLLQAACAQLCDRGVKALYVRADAFTQHVVTAIRASKMELFRQTYRAHSVLIIDDVQVFSRKGTTQEELFHTFNALHLDQKQIILSANCAPHELTDIEQRLVSRFEWGIVVPVKPLEQERWHELIETKASSYGLQISEQAVEFLLQTFSSNTTALMRAIEALALRGHLSGGSRPLAEGVVTIGAAKSALSDLVEEEMRSAITPEKIIQVVAQHHGITPDDILGSSKAREYVVPRQQAMWLCRGQLKLAYTAIGRLFGRDHSTVMSAIRQVKKQMEDPSSETSSSINQLSKLLNEVVRSAPA